MVAVSLIGVCIRGPSLSDESVEALSDVLDGVPLSVSLSATLSPLSLSVGAVLCAHVLTCGCIMLVEGRVCCDGSWWLSAVFVAGAAVGPVVSYTFSMVVSQALWYCCERCRKLVSDFGSKCRCGLLRVI